MSKLGYLTNSIGRTPIRFLLLILIACGSVYLGSFTFSRAESLKIFSNYAYWTLALTFGLFLFFLGRSLWRDWQGHALCIPSKRVLCIGALTVVCAMVFTLREEEPGFQVVLDDYLVAATSMSMHEDRKVEVPTRVVQLVSTPIQARSVVDKRPAFFPFLGSVVSDLTGYRPYNTIYLNMLLSAVLYALVFAFAYRIAGIWAGVSAVALIVSIPWVILLANGGGLEILNLLMIVACMILGARFLASPDSDRLGAFSMAGILLAQTRYESVLFLLGIILTVLWWWIREWKIQVPWVLFLCPPLLIPYLLQNRVFEQNAQWQMYDVQRGEAPFGFEYIADNLARAAHFFFNWESAMGNSILLSLVGIIAVLSLLVYGLKRVRKFPELPILMQSLVLWLPTFFALFVLLLMYGWEFDSPVTRRLALPLYLPLCFLGVYMVFKLIRSSRFHRVFLGIVGVYFIGIAFPYTSQGRYRHVNAGPKELRIIEDYVQQTGDERGLYLSDVPFLFVLYGKQATHINFANARLPQIKWYLEQPGTTPLYYVGRYVYVPGENKYEIGRGVDLSDKFETETVYENHYSTMRLIRVVRITGVKDTEMPEPDEPLDTPQKYIQFLSKQLP